MYKQMIMHFYMAENGHIWKKNYCFIDVVGNKERKKSFDLPLLGHIKNYAIDVKFSPIPKSYIFNATKKNINPFQ